MLFEAGRTICPDPFPHAASERLGIDAVPFPFKMTTICFVGPSAYTAIHSALTLFPDEFEAKVAANGDGPTPIPVTVSTGSSDLAGGGA